MPVFCKKTVKIMFADIYYPLYNFLFEIFINFCINEESAL